MIDISLFSSVSESDRAQMLHCLAPQKKYFKKSETIATLDDENNKIGFIIKGSAALTCLDYNGDFSVIERLSEKDVFGNIFTKPFGGLEYIISAESDCEIYFIPYENIIKRCSEVCICHTQMINNLFHIAALKSQAMAIRINILSQKSLRQKISAYLEYCRNITGKNDFTISMNLSRLSEYLCVDRSAMMREIKRMNEENLISSRGRWFKIM